MMSAIVGQPHPDVTKYLERVANGSGVVKESVQVALTTFVNYCYRRGHRSITGGAHQIQLCYIPCTTTLAAGTYEKLWHPSGNPSAISVGGSPTYTENTGVGVNGTTIYLDSQLAGNTFSYNNLSLFVHNLSSAGNKDYIGCNDSAIGAGTSRFLIHPRWTDDNNMYFDIVNSSTGRVSAANGTNSLGLILGYKSNAVQGVYQRGALLVQSTTAPTTGTMPSDTITCMYGTSGDAFTTRNIGGFGAGLTFGTSTIANFTTAWNALQTSLAR